MDGQTLSICNALSFLSDKRSGKMKRLERNVLTTDPLSLDKTLGT